MRKLVISFFSLGGLTFATTALILALYELSELRDIFFLIAVAFLIISRMIPKSSTAGNKDKK